MLPPCFELGANMSSTIESLKALADPNRLAMVLLIDRQQELCVCELMAALALPQTKVSRLLALLKEAGLLADRRQGKWVFYRLVEALPLWLSNALPELQQVERDVLQLAEQKLQQMGARPERLRQCCLSGSESSPL